MEAGRGVSGRRGPAERGPHRQPERRPGDHERIQVTHTDVELTGPTTGATQRESGTPLVDARPSLADPIPEVLDASGQPIANGAA